MIRIVLIGSGQVAYHLHKAMMNAKGVTLEQLVARRPEALGDFAPPIPRSSLKGPIAPADIYVLAVSDAAIAEVSAQLPSKDALFVHTSGATSREVLRGHSRTGVLYPLQTFSKDREIDFRKVPLILETGKPADLALLRDLALALSNSAYEFNEAQRKQLHLAAVFVNNFANHMVYLGEAACQDHGITEDLLKPLIRETWMKLETLSAFEAQTGPARRRDAKTLQEHLLLLDDPLRKQLYQLLSESITKTYEQEL